MKFAHGDGQTGEGDIGIGPGIAQPLGLLAQMSGHRRQKLGPPHVQSVAQLEIERVPGGRIGGKSEAENRGGLAVKIGALPGGENHQTSCVRGLADRCRDGVVRSGGHGFACLRSAFFE